MGAPHAFPVLVQCPAGPGRITGSSSCFLFKFDRVDTVSQTRQTLLRCVWKWRINNFFFHHFFMTLSQYQTIHYGVTLFLIAHVRNVTSCPFGWMHSVLSLIHLPHVYRATCWLTIPYLFQHVLHSAPLLYNCSARSIYDPVYALHQQMYGCKYISFIIQWFSLKLYCHNMFNTNTRVPRNVPFISTVRVMKDNCIKM